VEEIIDELNRICNSIAKNSGLAEDLRQEVLIVLLAEDKIDERLENGTLFVYAYGIAYKMFHLSGSKFWRTHRKYRYFESEELDQVTETVGQETTEERVDEIIKALDEAERRWLREYKSRNCSIKKLSEDSKISRPSITERLNEIFKIIRCTTLN
jgi:DNA-directed RNA polymerase specialized sigma24 family protein